MLRCSIEQTSEAHLCLQRISQAAKPGSEGGSDCGIAGTSTEKRGGAPCASEESGAYCAYFLMNLRGTCPFGIHALYNWLLHCGLEDFGEQRSWYHNRDLGSAQSRHRRTRRSTNPTFGGGLGSSYPYRLPRCSESNKEYSVGGLTIH